MQRQPSSFGPWSVVRQLGRGGMGVVWHCVHEQSGRQAAVKTVLDATDPGSLAREVFALSRLTHPQIVRILDEGMSEGRPWYAMETVPGVSLRTVLDGAQARPRTTFALDQDHPTTTEPDSGGLPLARALEVFGALCSPLATLHGAGLVHRDLKPDNVVIRPDGIPVLVDFGLATSTGGRATLLGAAATPGTPDSVSPEQIRGERVDPRADLYALGCLAFELLTGRPPFVGEVSQQLVGHLHQAPPRLADLRPEVPAAVCDLVAHLLRKARDERPGHALEVAATLEELGVPLPAQMGPPPRPYVYRPTLVGRDALLTRWDSILDTAAAGTGGVHLVVGPSGRGKTRLLGELAQRARRRGMVAVAAGCAAVGPGAGPDEPIRTLLRPLGAPTLAGLIPTPSESEPLLRTAEQERLEIAATEVVLAASAQTPLLVILDDLQWAGPTLRGIVQRLSERHGEGALCLCLAWRSEEEDAALCALREAFPTDDLETLSREQTEALIRGMLAEDPPEVVLDWAVAGSQGSPLWVAEGVETLVQSGLLQRSGSGWKLAADATLPELASLDALLALRLQDLTSEVREALAHLALQGKRIDRRWLGLPERQVAEAIRVLTQRGVLEDLGPNLAFVHDAVRDAVVRAVPATDRLRLHRGLAHALDSSTARDEALEALAQHLAASGQRAAAADVYAEAAEGMGSFAAARLWESAVEADETGAHTPERRRRAVEAWSATDLDRAEVHADALRRDADRLGDPATRLMSLEADALVLHGRGHAAEAEVRLRRGLELATDMDVRWRLSTLLNRALARQRRKTEAVVLLESLAHNPQFPRSQRFDTWIQISGLRAQMGHLARAKQALDQADVLAAGEVQRIQWLDMSFRCQPGFTSHADLQKMRAAAERLEALHHLRLAAQTREHAAVGAMQAALYEEGEHEARCALEAAVRLGDHTIQCYCWYYLCLMQRVRGALDDATHSANQVVEEARRVHNPLDIADGYCELGHLELARGRDGRPFLALADAQFDIAGIHEHAAIEARRRLVQAIEDAANGQPLLFGESRSALTPPQIARAIAEGHLSR